MIKISIAEQRLQLLQGNQPLMDVLVSTAKNGPGEKNGSECTPRGWHKVRAKIGTRCSENSVFVARRPTGEVYRLSLRKEYPDRDWILTRILWLSGLEPGKNRLGCVDTMRRFIYIHGSPEDDPMGRPTSHGCIKMRNAEVIQLFDKIEAGITVEIIEGTFDG